MIIDQTPLVDRYAKSHNENHVIFYDAFGRFYNRYRRGRGYCYVFNCGNRFLKKSPLFGHIAGIVYWLFNEGVC